MLQESGELLKTTVTQAAKEPLKLTHAAVNQSGILDRTIGGVDTQAHSISDKSKLAEARLKLDEESGNGNIISSPNFQEHKDFVLSVGAPSQNPQAPEETQPVLKQIPPLQLTPFVKQGPGQSKKTPMQPMPRVSTGEKLRTRDT